VNDKSLRLVFHLLNAVHAVTVEVAINIDDDGNGDSRFSGSNTNGKERKEEAIELSGVENAVECSKVDVNGIQDQLGGDKHGYQVSTSNKPEHSDKEQ